MVERYQELEKKPPQNIRAEAAVLRILFHNNELIEETKKMLPAEEFYKHDHNIIYKTMLRLFDENMPVDLITLADRLEQEDNLEFIGDLDHLKKLFLERSPEMETDGYSPANLGSHIEIIHEKFLLRRLIVCAEDTSNAAFLAGGLGDKSLRRSLEQLLSAAKIAINFQKSKEKK